MCIVTWSGSTKHHMCLDRGACRIFSRALELSTNIVTTAIFRSVQTIFVACFESVKVVYGAVLIYVDLWLPQLLECQSRLRRNRFDRLLRCSRAAECVAHNCSCTSSREVIPSLRSWISWLTYCMGKRLSFAMAAGVALYISATIWSSFLEEWIGEFARGLAKISA